MSVTAQALANARLVLAQQIDRIDKVKQTTADITGALDAVRSAAAAARDMVDLIQDTISSHAAEIAEVKLDMAKAKNDIANLNAHNPHGPPNEPPGGGK